MSSEKTDSLTSSLSIWMCFISFCCLIAEARTFSTMLNNSGETRHPCRVPDLMGKALSLSPLRMILAVGLFVYDLYDVEVCSFFLFKILFICVCVCVCVCVCDREKESEHKQGEQEAGGEASSMLSREPDAELDPRTLGS